jgi:hypothetical protein
MGVLTILGYLVALVGFTADLKSHGIPIPNVMENPDHAAHRQYAYSELEKTIRGLLVLISDIVIQSTAEWLPRNEDEFFSPPVATLICRGLNVASKAPVFPDISWLAWIDQRTREVEKELQTVLTSYPSLLPKSLLEKVVAVKNSLFFIHPRQMVVVLSHDKQKPPLLCPGLEDLMMEKFLTNLRSLYDELWTITQAKRQQMPSEALNLKNRIGKSRFSADDLRKWATEHSRQLSGRPSQSASQN